MTKMLAGQVYGQGGMSKVCHGTLCFCCCLRSCNVFKSVRQTLQGGASSNGQGIGRTHHSNSAGSQEHFREKDDGFKIDYLRRALPEDSEFSEAVTLDHNLQDAIEWAKEQASKETLEKRECAMRAIEKMGQDIRTSGSLHKCIVFCIWCTVFRQSECVVCKA